MIDTILLKIPAGKFQIVRPEFFQPNAKGIFVYPFLPWNGQPFIRCVQNPTKEDKINGIYKPRLTVYKRKAKAGEHIINLHVEFSIPKLLYGNNFDEVDDSDFEGLIELLYARLLKMGVVVMKADLKQIPVYAVHYSKNIAFTDYTTVSYLLGHFEKIKLNRRFDLNKTDYGNNSGELVRYHTKTFQLVFYDKIAELKYSKDTAIEKQDRAFNLQPSFFDEVKRKAPLEVLRIEIRFNERRKISKVLDLELHELTFENLFRKTLARKVLLSHWRAIYEELKPVLLQDLTPLEHFELLARQLQKSTPQTVLSMLGISILLKSHGYRPVQKNFEKFYSSATFGRYYKAIKSLDFGIHNRSPPFLKITTDLEAFQPLKMNQFTL